MLRFKMDEGKALAALLYVLRDLAKVSPYTVDMHKVFKILYFADKEHLLRFGRPVIGDVYIALKHGPVPSRLYDIVKLVRDESNAEYMKYFVCCGAHFLKPVQAPDVDELSESDIECLDKSITEHRLLTFKQLTEKSHDEAYHLAQKDDRISFKAIAKAAGANPALLEYIHHSMEAQSLCH